MPSRGQTITLTFTAWDTVNQIGKTGDAANFTLKWIKDGTPATPTNVPAVEVDATNAKGEYRLVMTGTECTCDFGKLAGISSTPGIVIIPIAVAFEQLPTAVAGASGGLPINGANLGATSWTNGITVTTTTNLTNLPAIPANWLTAAGIAAAALNGKGDWTTSTSGNADVNVVTVLGQTPQQVTLVGGNVPATLVPTGLDAVMVESGLNARQALAIHTASLAGVLAGAATSTVTVAAAGDPFTNRITASVDTSGNRTAVTLAPPA